MFKKNTGPLPQTDAPTERITSVLGPGINWRGNLRGSGGVRIEGAFEGEINIHGLVVVGETGRITTDQLRSNTVIVAGSVKGNIAAEKLEIRSTGRIWGDVTVVAFTTEEGGFLRGQVRMEEKVDMTFEPDAPAEPVFGESEAPQNNDGEMHF